MEIRSVNNPAIQSLGGAAAHRSASAPRPQNADAAAVRAASDQTAAPRAQADPEPDRKVQQAPKTIEIVLSERSGTRLRIDKATNQIVAQIVDRENRVIKQIPPPEALKIAAKLRELRGKLFDESV